MDATPPISSRCVIVSGGKIFRSVLLHERISPADFDKALCENGVDRINDTPLAFLETDGRMTMVKKQSGQSTDQAQV